MCSFKTYFVRLNQGVANNIRVKSVDPTHVSSCGVEDQIVARLTYLAIANTTIMARACKNMLAHLRAWSLH